jgi:hypothetical protein
MINVQNDFATRSEEVTRYFHFLQRFDDRRVTFIDAATDPFTFSPPEQLALFKTLKANGFLLLYNLVESTSKNAIEAIFDEFKSQGVSFDHCRAEVKKIILENLRKHNVEAILPALSALSIDVMVSTFSKDRLFDGNVDAKHLRKVAKTYGFRNPRKKSDELLTVKSNRNDLAHGNKSFADVGRDYDVDRLEKIRIEVVTFLKELLDNVADYITSRSYLALPPSP